MPRWTVQLEGPRDPAREFDLCARCSADPEVMRVVAGKKSGAPPGEPPLAAPRRIPHTSYDFAPRPVPCISCARVLGAEDD
jgi:hypothetical protein